MTLEDKELLFKDLCGRLPYGVKVKYPGNETMEIRGIDSPSRTFSLVKWGEWNYTAVPICEAVWDGEGAQEFKPYLRPMSSMTDEEVNEFQAFHCVDGLHPYFYQQMCNLQNLENMFNWLISHHFDYRGLIEKGLALEAPEDMYKTE